MYTFLDCDLLKHPLSNEVENQLYDVFNDCFENINVSDYYKKHFSNNSKAVKHTARLYFRDGLVIGYIVLKFQESKNNVFITGSVGMCSVARGLGAAKNAIQSVFTWVLKYKIKNLFKRLYLADTVLNPAWYKVMKKQFPTIQPNKESYMDPCIDEVLSEVNAGGYISEVTGTKCLLKVDRKSLYSEQDITRLLNHKDPDIAFYCKVNPNFYKDQGSALFIAAPVNLKLITTLIMPHFKKNLVRKK